ncbi:beta-N-acetylhexosaminidase [Membranihabitans marinus]|uniref:beta-N-acetylhexosaminidase n=1 Tax=Membranihabitans marinus TaxID=1227546 RepID=UPI001F45C9E9|nr:beta-N-acetylhexosaminidase [Membranihabitans marinus]
MNTKSIKSILWLGYFNLVFLATGFTTELSRLGLNVIPYPQEVIVDGEAFYFNQTNIFISNKYSEEVEFTIRELVLDLKSEYGIDLTTTTSKGKSNIVFQLNPSLNIDNDQGYTIDVSKNKITVEAISSVGLFHASQTILQLIIKGKTPYIPGMQIADWPDILERAVHYDTKHHQDKKSYVKKFIRDMARYKINMIVWEWEDKLAYESHPDIGAPGAFTIEEMKEFTAYARQYHIQLVPLVQGLGHVSFILKWPQYHHLREVDDSAWEFCPLKEGTYDLLFALWKEAIEATPGSEYIHIGSDETYELAHCHECKDLANEIGASGVYHLFVEKANEFLQKLGRKVMVWERPMGWEMSTSPITTGTPDSTIILTESYEYEDPDFTYAKKAKELGFTIFAYDPNPGIEMGFLPYFYSERDGINQNGSLQNSYDFLKATSQSGLFDGMINTSWDDSGHHNQTWMLSFVTSAAFSWNGSKPDLEEFTTSFFQNYYGDNSTDLIELFQLLNEGAYYYMSTFERKVWHWGDVGKTHLPDLPRGENIEYDPYWNREYKDLIVYSRRTEKKMYRAIQIINNNLAEDIDNAYDLRVFKTVAEVIRNTALTVKDLSSLEFVIRDAHRSHYVSHQQSLNLLNKARQITSSILERKESTFANMVSVWEETQFPKGYSTPDKKYFFQQDRARHFANRTADLRYWIHDEDLLGIEHYTQELDKYIDFYKNTYLH